MTERISATIVKVVRKFPPGSNKPPFIKRHVSGVSKEEVVVFDLKTSDLQKEPKDK